MNILFFSTKNNFKLPILKTNNIIIYKTTKIEETINLIEVNVFSVIFLDYKNLKNNFSKFLKSIISSSPYSKIALINFEYKKELFLKLSTLGVDFFFDTKWTAKDVQKLLNSEKIKLNFNERGVPYLFSDDLTTLYNRRLLNKKIEALIKYNENSFAVLFIDIDNFKAVNEKYGHLVASKTLKHLGTFLNSFGASNTNLFRYGGDEFVFILTETSVKVAKEFAEKIRLYTENKTLLVEDKYKINLTLSIGVSVYPNDASTAYDILNLADKAMFYSKHNNKNRVYLAQNL